MRSRPCAAAGAALLLALSTTARAQQPAPGAMPPAPGSAEPDARAGSAPDSIPKSGEETNPAAQAEEAAADAGAAQQPMGAGAGTGATARTGAAAAEDPFAPGWRERLHIPVGPIALAPILLLQTQVTPYAGDDSYDQAGDIAERPGFRLRRARFGLAGGVQERVRFAMSAELGSDDEGTLLVHDAWAGYTAYPSLQIFAGARTVPFSRSAMTGAGDSALIERPLAVRAIAPFTQVGVQAEGHFADEAFSYHAGVYNGFQRSDQFYEGHLQSLAPLGNRFEGIAVEGRVASEPLGPLGRTIQDVAHSPLRIGVGGDYFFSNGGARTLHGAGGDILLHASGLHVLAEMLWLHENPESQPTQPITEVTSISSIGILGEVGYMIVARRFGVTARVEWIDPDSDVDNEGDNLVTTAGVSYHMLDDFLKAQLDYTHREELFGLSLANDAVTLQLQLSL